MMKKELAKKTMGAALATTMWAGKATTFMVGLAVVLALTVGLASTALAGTGVGARFDLGKTNTVNAITKLVGSVAGPSLQLDNNSADANATALDLQVEPGKAPMRVNSGTTVANLSADKLDGKSASEIGVNGLERVSNTSISNSNSPKGIGVQCPPGKVVVGTGAAILGGKKGATSNEETDVVIDHIIPIGTSQVFVDAYEEEPTSASWQVVAYAICVTGP
jgi:hypothetical protein